MKLEKDCQQKWKQLVIPCFPMSTSELSRSHDIYNRDIMEVLCVPGPKYAPVLFEELKRAAKGIRPSRFKPIFISECSLRRLQDLLRRSGFTPHNYWTICSSALILIVKRLSSIHHRSAKFWLRGLTSHLHHLRDYQILANTRGEGERLRTKPQDGQKWACWRSSSASATRKET